jgi:thioredoxin reductase
MDTRVPVTDMTAAPDVAIVGAGPYGLSIAAHLGAAGVPFRIFGRPMQTWRDHMPDGMLLKSDGFASNLSDPSGRFTLERFCALTGTPYGHADRLVSLETFRAYGLAFQERLVPQLEDTQVVALEREEAGFRLHLGHGGSAVARQVVLAVGIAHFHHVPPVLEGLPAHLMSHSSAHKDVTRLRGRAVAVVGAGASAADLAVLLTEAGAQVTLIARRSQVRFLDPPPAGGVSRWAALQNPRSPIGPGWRSRLYCEAPGLFHRLPSARRWRIARTYLGPATGWPMRERFEGRVTTLLAHEVIGAEVTGEQACLQLAGPSGRSARRFDHVIAATGYRVDLRRLAFLGPEILARLQSREHAPVLSARLESSVPGLYFVGVAAAHEFGPMMRFACGAGWTARHLARTLARRRRGSPARAA